MSKNISRRSFVRGAMATGAAFALAGSSALPVLADDVQQGGAFRFYLTTPKGIIPLLGEENQGITVMYQLYEPLAKFNWKTSVLEPCACESWEVNEACDQFTFHLRPEATWHDGNPVTAQDFIYAWNMMCDPNLKPSASQLGYKLSQVRGADEKMAGEDVQLDLEAPDDYTLVVNLKAPFGDFANIVAETCTSPIPAGSIDTEEAFMAFGKAPIGNGPFKMKGEWVDGQYILLEKYEGYYGTKPNIDEVQFIIFKDDSTAWTEFTAGNLDYTIIPAGMMTTAIAMYGEAPDGYTSNPGEQVVDGPQTSIYYLLCNNNDEVISNLDLRIAISYAIDRTAIAQVACDGSRLPASDMLAGGIPGAVDGGWPHCPETADKEEAAKWFDKAGYPADANGKRDLHLVFSTNSSSINEAILLMVIADLEQCGVSAELSSSEWATYIQACSDGDYQIGRMGWSVQVPYADAVLQPLFYTGNGDNRCFYSNPEFDAAIDAARQISDDDERLEAYKQANAMVAADMPVIPLLSYRLEYVTSSRVHNLYTPASSYYTYNEMWLA